MRHARAFGVTVLITLVLCCRAKACMPAAPDVRALLSSDPAVVQQAIAAARAQGPRGLKQLLDAYDQSPDPRLIPAIDAVAGQRGALSARLFWYTDLDQAKTTARAAHKPILYLRLMGKLTDEYSCANSRFFRTVLYANTGVSKLLRDNFVLVWCSERPVPVVTIDYGDGRVLKRTLTGNSIHYVLNADGQVIDALPGLYDPKTFAAILNEARPIASQSPGRSNFLESYLRRMDDRLLRDWQQDMQKAGLEPTATGQEAAESAQHEAAAPSAPAPSAPAPRTAPAPLGPTQQPIASATSVPAQRVAAAPAAAAAMRRAFSKSVIEAPLLAKISPDIAVALDKSMDSADPGIWQKIAEQHAADAVLDESSLAVMRAQYPFPCRAPQLPARVVEQFQKSIALDTVQNNYTLRRRILAWLIAAPGQVTLEELNRRVYAELFLTPRSDPWLGLLPADGYSALNNEGCVVGR